MAEPMSRVYDGPYHVLVCPSCRVQGGETTQGHLDDCPLRDSPVIRESIEVWGGSDEVRERVLLRLRSEVAGISNMVREMHGAR